MNALERMGNWLAPIARGMGISVEKGSTVTEPTDRTINSSDELYALIYGSGVFNDVHPIVAYRLLLKSDVLGTAVHRIAQNIAGFQLGLTTDQQDFDADAPLIRFLMGGSEGYSKRRFFYELATSYLITNEAWMVLRGRVTRPPIARTWVYPFDIDMQMSSDDGLPVSITTHGDRDRRTYKRVEQGERIRFIDDQELNELCPILGAEAIDRPWRGQSPLASLLYSVQQNVEGKRHNTSVLKNGLRLTGAVQPTEGDRFEQKAKADIVAAFQALRGSSTAGGTLVLPKRVEVVDLALSNREMDYVNLLTEAKESVYNFYNIPLPLISNEASTFNNYATAQTAFFDGAVFPIFDDIADALTDAFVTRYPEIEGQHITQNENTIRALRGRNLDRMRKMRETQALTTNEIRQAGGYDEIEDGEDVLAPTTLAPIGPTSGMSFPGESSEPMSEAEDEDVGALDEETEGGEST